MTGTATSAAAYQRALDAGQQLVRFADSVGLDPSDIVQALAAVTVPTPPGSEHPSRQLSEAENAALRRSGALGADLPAPADWASTRTAARTALLTVSAYTVKDVAQLLNRSEIRVRQRLAEHTLLGVRDGRSWRIPTFQFQDGTELPGWDKVMAAFPPDVHPLTVKRFVDNVSPELDIDGQSISPRRWLASDGDVKKVVALAGELHQLP